MPKKKSSAAEFRKFQLRALRCLLLSRSIEERMLLLLRQGKVSKWFSGIGQEAISVGATLAMQDDEFILPLHRNLGVFTTRGVNLEKLVAQWQGKLGGFTKARDRSFHFGTLEHRIVGMISHLGPQLAIADGIALAHRLGKEKKAVLVFTGEGGTSEGDFHEALNIAATWRLPVIFVVENNGYALSTPTSEQYACKRLSDRAAGYGMRGMTIDGNDLMEVYSTVSKCARAARAKPEPFLIECMTFRMRGHEEASGVKYVPKALLAAWGKKDPVTRFERLARRNKVLTAATSKKLRTDILAEIDVAIEAAFAQPEPEGDDTGPELSDVYAALPLPTDTQSNLLANPPPSKTIRFVDAISEGLQEAMKRHPKLILMGQDIAEYGGVFKVTEGFVKQFGRERVRNTPLCESGVLGAALGLSLCGYKSMVEMQFADFVSCGFNQIVNNLAKLHYRWGHAPGVVVRMPTGAGAGAGPFHSQSNEAWFCHTPGLKVVYPSTPADAKGLLLAAFEDGNPTLFFEHKALYRSASGEVPAGYYTTPIGEARTVCEGEQLTIITYGLGVRWAEEFAAVRPDLSLYILDLRTLLPLDTSAMRKATEATGRVLVLTEDCLSYGTAAEIAAWLNEHCFEYLDAPIVRVGSLDTPVPFHPALERQFLGRSRLAAAVEGLLAY